MWDQVVEMSKQVAMSGIGLALLFVALGCIFSDINKILIWIKLKKDPVETARKERENEERVSRDQRYASSGRDKERAYDRRRKNKAMALEQIRVSRERKRQKLNLYLSNGGIPMLKRVKKEKEKNGFANGNGEPKE